MPAIGFRLEPTYHFMHTPTDTSIKQPTNLKQNHTNFSHTRHHIINHIIKHNDRSWTTAFSSPSTRSLPPDGSPTSSPRTNWRLSWPASAPRRGRRYVWSDWFRYGRGVVWCGVLICARYWSVSGLRRGRTRVVCCVVCSQFVY